jgi:hypothetical protein
MRERQLMQLPQQRQVRVQATLSLVQPQQMVLGHGQRHSKPLLQQAEHSEELSASCGWFQDCCI